MRTPPLLHQLLHRPPRLHQTRLAHTRRLFIDIDRDHQVERIAQPHERLSAFRLFLELRFPTVAGGGVLAIEEGGVRVGGRGSVAVQRAGGVSARREGAAGGVGVGGGADACWRSRGRCVVCLMRVVRY